jgi:hypothetical protein
MPVSLKKSFGGTKILSPSFKFSTFVFERLLHILQFREEKRYAHFDSMRYYGIYAGKRGKQNMRRVTAKTAQKDFAVVPDNAL